MQAASGGYTDSVRVLLAKGANVNVKDKEGKTALMLAKQNKHREIVRLLEQAGVKI